MYPDFPECRLGYMVKGCAIIFIPLFSVGFNIFLTPGEFRPAGLKPRKLSDCRLRGDPPDFPDYGIFADDLTH